MDGGHCSRASSESTGGMEVDVGVVKQGAASSSLIKTTKNFPEPENATRPR